ncbi:S-adenosyl-L-methionine-dependent methyltransferase [Leucogyrophana mollusca]|uniref:S-adenosyl-L-methionine-dependent methyltransferase n=1 Tax=Leucogyrophana mollusca TaxID=85980 RepID=A0ACB8B5P5_9AGAM|nr:S-adenosyl-L-methionine-dependent methyltransferase [Leucogyrophana mollusca]
MVNQQAATESAIVSAQSPRPGRYAHSFPGAQYLLPADEEERSRLALQHELFKRVMGGRIILPSMSFDPDAEILDSGTGSAIWLIDCRSQLPASCQFYGIDIESKLYPDIPTDASNLHLSVASITALPRSWTAKFALVNQRLLMAGLTVPDWKVALEEIHRVLKPGGFIQLMESDSDSIQSGPETAAAAELLRRLMVASGLNHECSKNIEGMLMSAGFVDVYSEDVVVKVGKWAGRDGVDAREDFGSAFRGLKGAVLKAGGMGYADTPEEFDQKVDRQIEEWDRTEGSCTKLKAFYARKP